MNAKKSDAIQFLKSSIARYRHQLDGLSPRGSGDGVEVLERATTREERDQLNALIADATRLLSQLRHG
jgi:hypothetical protein